MWYGLTRLFLGKVWRKDIFENQSWFCACAVKVLGQSEKMSPWKVPWALILLIGKAPSGISEGKPEAAGLVFAFGKFLGSLQTVPQGRLSILRPQLVPMKITMNAV